MKKIICLLLIVIFMLPVTLSCEDNSEATLISFSEANSVDYLRSLNGNKVAIIGYMSSLSPVSGKFIYLMNMPYQSCPFCIPNTTQLSNTIAVYAKGKNTFQYTDKAIYVTGTLRFGDFEDEYGYRYNYRIENASCSDVNTSDMNETLRLWQQFASADILQDVAQMYEYINFLCYWYTYTARFSDGNGNTYEDYLYPQDALAFVETDGGQYNYGYKDGYFDSLISRIEVIDKTAFTGLTENIKEAESLAQKALEELKSGNYTHIYEYSEYFGKDCWIYKPTKADEIGNDMTRIYDNFSNWLASWEI